VNCLAPAVAAITLLDDEVTRSADRAAPPLDQLLPLREVGEPSP